MSAGKHTPGPWAAEIARVVPESEPFGFFIRHAERRRSVVNCNVYETATPVLPVEWRDAPITLTDWKGHHYTPDELVANARLSDDSLQGGNNCELLAMLASSIARAWAMQRTDVSPDEVALAALLSESGELLLWHFAPELPLKVEAELSSGRAFRPLAAQQQAIGFSFKQLTLALVQAWQLPVIIALLIKGTDTPRANIARLAVETARYILANERHPSLPAVIINLKTLTPGAKYANLINPLPVPDDYKAEILRAVGA